MILKEAFTYQNYLSNLIEDCISYLTSGGNITKTKQEHLRTKSKPDANDEVIELPKGTDVNATPNQVIEFMIDITREKESLSKAINDAKLNADINIDSAIDINKNKQRVANILDIISNIKPSERVVRGSDYTFNADGNQVKYFYNIKEITTIDFNRNRVRDIAKRLRKESNETSNEIDKLQVTLEVSYSPIYDINDTFEESLEIFTNNNK